MTWAEVVAANVRLWNAVQRDETPPFYWVVGTIVPLVFRSVVYVLLGSLAAGADGAAWAYVGVVALALTGQTISFVSDIPMVDVWTRTYPVVSRAGVPVFAQYAARSAIHLVRALAEAAVVCVVVGPLTGHGSLVLPVLTHGWTLLPALGSCAMFGLAIMAPALANDGQNLVHNTATALLTLTSGALLAGGTGPTLLHTVGAVLPLQHSLAALRVSLAGGTPWTELALELLVTLGWGVVAAIAYRVVDERARRTGMGVA